MKKIRWRYTDAVRNAGDDDLHKDGMIKGRRCPEIDCTETYAHCYTSKKIDVFYKKNKTKGTLGTIMKTFRLAYDVDE